MEKFDGVLICTDLDGTLLRSDKSISRENIDAIEYFKKHGGSFTFVTGRMPYYVSDMYNAVNPNVPFGCVNGYGLFDHIKQEYIWKEVMPDDVMTLIKCVDAELPNVGIQVSTFDKTYFSKDNDAMTRFRRVSGLENLVCHYADVTEPIGKILFASDVEEEILQMERILKAHPLAGKFDFVRSDKTLYEILPKGKGKATALTKLTQYLGFDINNTIAIGDYNNDITMLQTAKIGIAVSNACPEALAAADFITVSNEEHAIAQVIYDLEKGKFVL